MNPLTVVTGVVLGSAFSIALGLSVVLLLFAVLGSEYPQVVSEREGLVQAIAMFTVLTALSGASFVGLLQRRRWRWLSQLAMWGVLLMVGFYYWPD